MISGTIARRCRLGRERNRLLNAATAGGGRREVATLLTDEERAAALGTLRSTTPGPHPWNEVGFVVAHLLYWLVGWPAKSKISYDRLFPPRFSM
jgi:hypothetical protein